MTYNFPGYSWHRGAPTSIYREGMDSSSFTYQSCDLFIHHTLTSLCSSLFDTHHKSPWKALHWSWQCPTLLKSPAPSSRWVGNKHCIGSHTSDSSNHDIHDLLTCRPEGQSSSSSCESPAVARNLEWRYQGAKPATVSMCLANQWTCIHFHHPSLMCAMVIQGCPYFLFLGCAQEQEEEGATIVDSCRGLFVYVWTPGIDKRKYVHCWSPQFYEQLALSLPCSLLSPALLPSHASYDEIISPSFLWLLAGNTYASVQLNRRPTKRTNTSGALVTMMDQPPLFSWVWHDQYWWNPCSPDHWSCHLRVCSVWFDGLFELGFNAIESMRRVKTFLDNAIPTDLLAQPVVSVFLFSERLFNGKGGEYLVGGNDSLKYKGSWKYDPVIHKSY